ncbi:IWS1 family protein [Tieghemostelium lacteum]|uniref:IWS1 family protein n=1 Tax=Tieghemostelium lacteum TaxID=361077 RepID=A0A152A9I3_TIELA|nr:IWS1 family protein [Tieghemostelium lacteum]|eukprot:KYR02880.1 IWS1 family protein [Tieghemostelium lacteum]
MEDSIDQNSINTIDNNPETNLIPPLNDENPNSVDLGKDSDTVSSMLVEDDEFINSQPNSNSKMDLDEKLSRPTTETSTNTESKEKESTSTKDTTSIVSKENEETTETVENSKEVENVEEETENVEGEEEEQKLSKKEKKRSKREKKKKADKKEKKSHKHHKSSKKKSKKDVEDMDEEPQQTNNEEGDDEDDLFNENEKEKEKEKVDEKPKSRRRLKKLTAKVEGETEVTSEEPKLDEEGVESNVKDPNYLGYEVEEEEEPEEEEDDNMDDIDHRDSDYSDGEGKKRKRSIKSKKPKEKTERKARSKKSKKDDENSVIEEGEPKSVNPFDEFMESIKKRKPKVLSDIEKDKIAETIITKMEMAAEQDLQSNRSKQPALAKLLLLPEVESILYKKDLSENLLEKNVYNAINIWLSPLPDGSQPNLKIKVALLKILYILPIRLSKIKDCNIPKTIVVIKKNEKETPEVKKLAYNIIDKWTRPVESHTDRKYEEKDINLKELHANSPSHKLQMIDDSSTDVLTRKLNKEDYLPSHVKHATGCERPKLDYTIRPVGTKAEPINSPIRVLNKIDKEIEKLKNPTVKGSVRAHNLSVEGRGLNILNM